MSNDTTSLEKILGTCEEIIASLLDYLSGELAPEQERRFEQHLADCPACVSYLRSYKRTVELGKEAMRQASQNGREANEPAARDLAEAILSRLRET